jgi:hypothetical protein
MQTSHIYSLDWSQEVGASLSWLCRSCIFQSAKLFYGNRVSSSSRSQAICQKSDPVSITVLTSLCSCFASFPMAHAA